MNGASVDTSDDSGVSPVVGVILMVAVTVVLSATVGIFVFNLGGLTSSAPPQASVSVDKGESDVTIQLSGTQTASHVVVQDGRGSNAPTYNLSEVGESVTFSRNNQKVTVYGVNDGKRGVLRTFNVYNKSHPSCDSIHTANPDAPSGQYYITRSDLGTIQVKCQMTIDGGGWTRFWWYKSGNIQSVTDFLGQSLDECSAGDPHCFATLPADNATELLVYTNEKNGTDTTAWAVWQFDSSIDTAVAAEDALKNGTIQPRGDTSQCWDPVNTKSYSVSWNGCQQEFWYENNNGTYTFNLDDDTAWADSSFMAGHPHNKDEGINAVDCLETDAAAGVQRHCVLYFR